MNVSIIVPTLNEAPLIQPFLQHLRKRASEAEIIVADAHSSDRTAQLAAPLADCIVHARPGRARQMNSGALIARSDILWFLHADAEVPWGCLEEIQRIMDDPKVVGGFFRIRLPPKPVYRMTDSFAHYAGIALRMRCGDHGMFCRRSVFAALGGFPDGTLMEDVEFFRLMRRQGPVICSAKRIIVSARRYETIGPLRLTLAYGSIAALYVLGVPPEKLASIYKRTCCQRQNAAASR
jgi:rSAM/selenodomain-associated transferase 2